MDRIAIATSLFSFATATAGLFLQISSPSTARPFEPALYLAADQEPGLFPAQLRPPGRRRHDLCDDFEARLAAGLTFAKVKLAIEHDQELAWSQFAAAASAGADPLRRECAATAGTPKPTTMPDALRRFERRATAALEAVHALRPAADTLYGQLTPAQQEAVDELFQHLP
jgi:hypothetical protein